jgi:predicted lipid carrier protein YhbT
MTHSALPIPAVVRPLVIKAVGLPGRLMPYAIQKPLLAIALNEALRQPFMNDELDYLEGCRVRIRVTDLQFDWLIRIGAGRVIPEERGMAHDVCISGNGLDFALLATRQADPDTLFFQRRIRIEGDTELGLGVKNTLDGMEWEDLPAPLTAMLTHLGRVMRHLQVRS